MAKMEMYSLRVSRDQKAAWDNYATSLGVDTSRLIRTVMDTATRIPLQTFVHTYPVLERDGTD